MHANEHSGFFLADQLKRDTLPVMDLRLCSLLLMNDSRYPWTILVPRVANAQEIFDLSHAEQSFLIEEISLTAKALAAISQPAKVNVGALGNIVRQLHVHVVARFEGDATWPGPVWGAGVARPYQDGAEAYLSLLRPQIKQFMLEQ